MGICKFSKDQAKILETLPRAIAERKPLVVTSGNAQGKDFISSAIGLWFLNNFGPSKVILTAPTGRQVRDIMWSEIETRWNSAKVELPGRIVTCKIEVEPDWYMIGFTTKETGGQVGKAQGFHSPNVCVIVSEAQAVADGIFEQLDSILLGKTALMIMIGNPLRTSGKFAKSIRNTTDNIVLNLDCLNSPNYQQKKEVIPGMASYEWIEQKRKDWNSDGKEDHPLWRARIRGLLPTSSVGSLFTPELVDKMVTTPARVTKKKIVTSCDPARMGDDECVIYGGSLGKIIKQDILPLSKADTVCSHVLMVVKETESNHIIIDADGLGGPICDFIRKLKAAKVYLQEVYANGKPDDDQYQNLKAEMWFYAKNESEAGREQIPDDEYLKEELMEMNYFINLKGKIQIESKEDLKERLGRSPDRADAWVMNVWARKTSKTISSSDAYNMFESEDSEEVSGGVESFMTA